MANIKREFNETIKIGEELNVEAVKKEYVFENLVKMDIDTLNSVRKGIGNERGRAGILMGFFFLFTIASFPYFDLVPLFVRGICFVLLTLSCYGLIYSFCSKPISDGVDTREGFSADWSEMSQCEFLKFHHDALRACIDQQKEKLKILSYIIKITVILLAVNLLILFLCNV